MASWTSRLVELMSSEFKRERSCFQLYGDKIEHMEEDTHVNLTDLHVHQHTPVPRTEERAYTSPPHTLPERCGEAVSWVK